MKKNIVIPTLTLALATLVGIGAYTGLAAASNGNGNGPGPNVSALAEKLGVDESKVEEAFAQIREERQAERQAQLSENLDKAVADGKITAEQKQLILDKHNELKTERQQRFQEMRQWAEDNGIDIDALREYGVGRGFGSGAGRGMGGHGMMNNN